MTIGASVIAAVRRALVGAAFAVCLPAGASADSAETTASFTVRPGRLAMYGVPAGRSFTPLIRHTAAGSSAVLPSIRVVDATGSGRGWHLAVSVVSGGSAWVRTAVSAYNGPARLRPRAMGDVQLAGRPLTVAFALRDHGMARPCCAASPCMGAPAYACALFSNPAREWLAGA